MMQLRKEISARKTPLEMARTLEMAHSPGFQGTARRLYSWGKARAFNTPKWILAGYRHRDALDGKSP